MPTKLSDIELLARRHLIEVTPKFWTSQELQDIIAAGIRDLWRDIADLKQEHFLTIDKQNVYFPSSSNVLNGVPQDVHKVYLIEPRSITVTSSNVGLQFQPLDFNHRTFQLARTRGSIDPTNDTIWYSITSAGGPVNAPVIYCAPQVSSDVLLTFCYVPVLGDFTKDSTVPIPGESTNALVAWTVAFARAKESEDRAPDANWIAVYATEKQHLLQSLGLRQYQEPSYADANFQEYWSWLLPLGIGISQVLSTLYPSTTWLGN